jgi:hypothetical protein
LATQSWRVLRGEGALVLLPVLSALVVVAVLLLLSAAGAALSARAPAALRYALGAAGLFLAYLTASLVVTFFTAALVGAALRKLRGEATSVGTGLRLAGGRAGAILGYAALAATAGVVLRLLRGRGGAGARGRGVAAGLGQAAWGLETFLVVPVLIGEGLGPGPALKRSASLVRRTWGEQLVGAGGLGAAFGLLSLGVVVVGLLLTGGLATAGRGAASRLAEYSDAAFAVAVHAVTPEIARGTTQTQHPGIGFARRLAAGGDADHAVAGAVGHTQRVRARPGRRGAPAQLRRARRGLGPSGGAGVADE